MATILKRLIVTPDSDERIGANVLYRNEGDGSFADITNASGTGADHIDGFITFVLDYDNDG